MGVKKVVDIFPNRNLSFKNSKSWKKGKLNLGTYWLKLLTRLKSKCKLKMRIKMSKLRLFRTENQYL